MSEKSVLNEYCQKHSIASPIYNTWSYGEHHKLQWLSDVKIKFGDKIYSVETLVPSPNKSSAEKQAALLMLEYIKTRGGKKTTESQLGKLHKSTIAKYTMGHKSLFEKKSKNIIKIKSADQPSNHRHQHQHQHRHQHQPQHQPQSNLNLVLDTESDSSSNSDSNSDTDDNDEDNDEHTDDSNYEQNDEYNVKYNMWDSDGASNNVKSKNIKIDKKVPKHYTRIYLIDLENKPQFSKRFDKSCLYIGFISSLHHSIKKYNKWFVPETADIKKETTNNTNNKLLYLIEGGVKNLVDHFITAFAYPLLEYTVDAKSTYDIFIITGDNAGWCTRACLEKIIKWKGLIHVRLHNNTSIS